MNFDMVFDLWLLEESAQLGEQLRALLRWLFAVFPLLHGAHGNSEQAREFPLRDSDFIAELANWIHFHAGSDMHFRRHGKHIFLAIFAARATVRLF